MNSAATLDGYLAMGGHAAFVWPAFAITLVVLVGLALVSTWTLRRRSRTLATLSTPGGATGRYGDA
jgi:heme exporter protein D